MSRAQRNNRQRISALGVPAAQAAGPAPQAGLAPQAVPVPQPVPVQAGSVPNPAAAAPQAAAAAIPPVGPPGIQVPAQGIND